MLVNLKKFKEHLDLMEGDFDQANIQQNELSKMLAQYEQTLNGQFGQHSTPARDEQGNLMASGRNFQPVGA